MIRTPTRAPYAIALGALAIWLGLLVGGGRELVARLGMPGLTPLFALWLVALPLCLGRLRSILFAEISAAVCLFAVGGGVHVLDELLETRLAVNGFFLLCGLWHLARHRRELHAVMRSPIVLAFALFVLQQLLSAWLAGSSDLPGIVRDRALMLLLFACTAVLVCRPGGRRLTPALILFGTLMSLPVMLQEMADPIRGLTEDGRAGGFYAQANVAGIMLSYGVACAGALHLEGAISARTLVALYVPFFVGLFCTASRGALVNALGALSVTWVAELHRRWGRRGLVTAMVGVAAFALLMAPLSEELVRAANNLDEVSSGNVERLQDTVLALSGSSDATDAMMTHDSGRLTLVDEALGLIAQRPLFGYGTGNFMREAARSHVQFLEVLGENGFFGGALYVALLLTIATALTRMPPRMRLCAAVVITPWFLTHFHNHNLAESLQLNVALGYVAGLATLARVDARARTAEQNLMIQVLRAQQQRWDTWQARSPNRGIFGAIVTVGGLTAIVRLSGLVKHQLIAYRFGLSDDYDAFIVAFALPAFLAGLVESISQSAFIPTFVSVQKHEGQAAAARLFASMMASALALLVGVLALLLVAERPILHLLAGGFDADKLERVRQLFHWLLPILFVSSVAGLWSSVLNAQGRFALAAIAPLMTPLCPIIAMLGFARFGIHSLAVGTVLGALVQCAILGVGLRRYGFPIRPRWHGSSPALRALVGQAAPMLVGALILSSNGIVDQTMASRLAPGSVAALEYGNRLTAFVVGIASLALGTAVLPHFSNMVVERDFIGIRHTLNTYVRWIALVSVAGTIVLVPLSMSIVRLLLQRGAFTEADTRMVSHVQICYLVQAPFYLIGILGVRLLSALGHNRTLVWISSMNVITNLVGNYLLMRVLGLPGIALSTACVYVCSMFVILHQVKAKLPCA